MKRTEPRTLLSWLFVSLFIGFVLTGCSGGGGGGGGGAPEEILSSEGTGTISGSVGGTTIIAVNDNGDIVSSDDTAGKDPDADGNYQFTLTGVPVGVDIRVYLVTEDGIFPMYFASDANVFSLSSATDINLGFVSTDTMTSIATPANDPADISGVDPKGENTVLPTGSPLPTVTEGLSLNELLTNGFDAISNKQALKARDYFKAAVDTAGSSTSNDADTARIFYAVTRVAALGFDTYSDGNPDNGLNNAGDILDGFGCGDGDGDGVADTNLLRVSLDDIECPEIMPDNSPTSGELQVYINNVLRPELEGAIANLTAISQTFDTAWTEPFAGTTVEIDYGDILVFRAAAEAFLANLLTQNANNLDVDIDYEVNYPALTTEIFLAENPDLLRLKESNELEMARDYLDSSLDDSDRALDWIQAETDGQADDLVNLQDTTSEEIAEAKAGIAAAKACLAGGDCTVEDNETPDILDDTILDLDFFFAGVDLRELLPTFIGDIPGLFPDESMGGVLIQGSNVNEDLNKDDVPDILEEEYHDSWWVSAFDGSSATIDIWGESLGSMTLQKDSAQVFISSDSTAGSGPAHNFPPIIAGTPLLKFPVTIEETWQASSTFNGYTVNSTTMVESITETVTMTYDQLLEGCAQTKEVLEYTDGTPPSPYIVNVKRWFCPGVGPAKFRVKFNDDHKEKAVLEWYGTNNADPDDFFPLARYSYWSFIMLAP